MNKPNEKQLDETALNRVTGGKMGNNSVPMGVFRCTVCDWAWPRESTNYPKPPRCQKCGAPMKWHMTREG